MTTNEFCGKLKSGYVWKNLAMMFLVIVVLVVGAAYGTDIYTHHGEAITVPDVRNKVFADAERLLDELGLQIVVTDTGYNRHLPPDCVLQQTPASGAVVKSGRVIYVTINASEKPTLTLPDIVDNSSEREAIAKLRILGFKVGATQYVPGEKGWVYGVLCRGRRLMAGDHVPIDAMVVLQVGNGSLSEDADLEVTDAEYTDREDDDVIDEANTPEDDPFEEVVE